MKLSQRGLDLIKSWEGYKDGDPTTFALDPYFDIDGNLTAARNMDKGFDKSTHGLKPVSVGEIHGLMFVCFDDNPPSLDGAIRDLEEAMAMFDFENLKVAAQKSYPIAANWKLMIENYQECYHCATAHPEYALMHTMMLDTEKQKRVSGHMHDRMETCGPWLRSESLS